MDTSMQRMAVEPANHATVVKASGSLSRRPSAATTTNGVRAGTFSLRPSRIPAREPIGKVALASDALAIIPLWARAFEGPRPEGRAEVPTSEVLRSAGSPLPADIRADLEKEISTTLKSPAIAKRQALDGAAERQAASVGDHVAGHRVTSSRPERPRHLFDDVRIHVDPVAASSAAALSAYAYTVGSHIVFGQGQYAPTTQAGRRILAHELAHVVQQRDMPTSEHFVQAIAFGDNVHLDSLPDDPPRARLIGPYRDEAVAQELYGDPAAPVQYSPNETLVVLVDMQRLLPRWRSLFDGPGPAPLSNTWPFPGFSRSDIQSYVDERAAALAVNLFSGRGYVTLDDNSMIEVPLRWFDARDLDIFPLLPVAGDRQEAETVAAHFSDLAAERGMTAVAFYRSAAVIWPTLLNPQTAPRIFSVFPQAFDAARADARAAEKTSWDLLFWYVGARTVPGVGTGGATQAGRLIIDSGRTLTTEEMAVVGRLLREGRTVRALAEATAQGVRTADFIVDGVSTELKTISNLTSKDLSGALSRRILEGAGQAPSIIADVRGQAGLTRELAGRAIRRAFGADTLARIEQIRIIGNDFDLTVPRL
jgi:Domain of unknown function (DUF4157)/Contact-dependent growth inhibition CdiA C-terminal domain